MRGEFQNQRHSTPPSFCGSISRDALGDHSTPKFRVNPELNFGPKSALCDTRHSFAQTTVLKGAQSPPAITYYRRSAFARVLPCRFSSVLSRGVSPWGKAYRLCAEARAKSLQRSASNFQSLQNPASGFQDSLNSSLRRNRRRSSPFLPASQSALATNGFAESLIRHRASLSGCFTAIRAGAFSNISCAAAQQFGGSRSAKHVSVPGLMKPSANRCKAN